MPFETLLSFFTITSGKMTTLDGFVLMEGEYSKLKDCIDDLATTINGTLSDQKKKVEKCHETQLRKLNLEIDQLKIDKRQLVDSISRNERVNLLENERDWYRKEALHLDKLLEQAKTENKDLNDKLSKSEAERKWMKDQLEKVGPARYYIVLGMYVLITCCLFFRS